MKSFWYRRNMSPEQKVHYNDMARLRMQNWRLRKKLAVVPGWTHKPETERSCKPVSSAPPERKAAGVLKTFRRFKLVPIEPDHGSVTAEGGKHHDTPMGPRTPNADAQDVPRTAQQDSPFNRGAKTKLVDKTASGYGDYDNYDGCDWYDQYAEDDETTFDSGKWIPQRILHPAPGGGLMVVDNPEFNRSYRGRNPNQLGQAWCRDNPFGCRAFVSEAYH